MVCAAFLLVTATAQAVHLCSFADHGRLPGRESATSGRACSLCLLPVAGPAAQPVPFHAPALAWLAIASNPASVWQPSAFVPHIRPPPAA